jgi:hypothetical protein
MTNYDVIVLKTAGLSDELIISKIKASPTDYKMDTEDLIALKKAGISDTVMQAMLEAQSRR